MLGNGVYGLAHIGLIGSGSDVFLLREPRRGLCLIIEDVKLMEGFGPECD